MIFSVVGHGDHLLQFRKAAPNERKKKTARQLLFVYIYIVGIAVVVAGAAGRYIFFIVAVRRALQIHKSCAARARAHTTNSIPKCIVARVFFFLLHLHVVSLYARRF